jgi:signal transduction histidine kinase
MQIELLFQDGSVMSPADAGYPERFQSLSLEGIGFSFLGAPYTVLNLSGPRALEAGEIHDSLAQSFTGITMQLEMAKELKTDKDDELFNYVERANDLARFGLAEARRSVMSLHSMTAKDSGLIGSLRTLAERSNIAGRLRCTFRSNLQDDKILPVEIRQDLLRIAQEAISNALRHAKSTAISVTLRSDPPNLVLQVKDNGVGITTKAETKEGFGFVNMRARVKKLKGTLDIRTVPGRGTNIIVTLPFKEELG